ncbi:hypothetical protein FRB96_009296 [Tulasnella sp. 330]|nr:hypothetical protein FRB96_009296 [Tulasnella sp. 330]
MAHPSSSHRDRDDDRGTIRDRERERETRRTSTVHHHRTISSTTLLLVLSLILAVLAVMLSLPSRSSGVLPSITRGQSAQAQADPGMDGAEGGPSHSFWGYLTPKRSHALVSRESNVALREAEVARREAELLVGPPAGFQIQCPVCEPIIEEYDPSPSLQLVTRPAPPAPPAPTTTIIQEVIREVESQDPGWLKTRIEGLVERETKISDREKEVGQREETVGKREADATKREGWIMEQLNALAPEPREAHARVEEEYVYEKYEDQPRHYYGEARRVAPKEIAMPAPIPVPTSTVVVTATETITQVVPPPPAGTRLAAHPTPETFVKGATGSHAGKTKEIYIEEPQETVTVYERDQAVYDREQLAYEREPLVYEPVGRERRQPRQGWW